LDRVGNRVLSDHKKIKNTLFSPINHLLGEQHDMPWLNLIVPELIWISMIINRYGESVGIVLVSDLAGSCFEIESGPVPYYACISTFRSFPLDRVGDLFKRLGPAKLEMLHIALSPLLSNYPECPLRFIMQRDFDASESDLSILGRTITSIADKSSRLAIITQATQVKIAFDSGRLKVMHSVGIANLSEINDFPKTEESKRVAGSIRATTPVLVNTQLEASGAGWSSYFWDRGLELSPCVDFADE